MGLTWQWLAFGSFLLNIDSQKYIYDFEYFYLKVKTQQQYKTGNIKIEKVSKCRKKVTNNLAYRVVLPFASDQILINIANIQNLTLFQVIVIDIKISILACDLFF